MRAFHVTISNGSTTDTFRLLAENREKARDVAVAAHVGTGWEVLCVRPKNHHKKKSAHGQEPTLFQEMSNL